MARSCLPSLPLHVSDVFAKPATLGGVTGLHLGLRSSEQLLIRGAQGWRLWPGTATLPLEILVHWRRKSSAWRPHRVIAIVMPILPADHVPGPPR